MRLTVPSSISVTEWNSLGSIEYVEPADTRRTSSTVMSARPRSAELRRIGHTGTLLPAGGQTSGSDGCGHSGRSQSFGSRLAYTHEATRWPSHRAYAPYTIYSALGSRESGLGSARTEPQ